MANLNQSHFRFGKEELLEATHGWWQLEDVNHTQLIAADWVFLLRFTEQEPGVGNINNVDAQFQYNKNGAGWVNITTTSSVVKAVASVAFTNGQNCTKRLSGTGTFESSGAGCTEDGTSGGAANDIVLSGNSETEAALQVVAADVVNGDTIQFRLTSPDATIIYIVTPTLTITKLVVVEGTASGSGNGLASLVSLLYVLAASAVSGIGLATSLSILDILAQASGQGIGLASALGDAFPPFVVVEGTGSGQGIGLASAQGVLDIFGVAPGSSIGDGEATALVITLAQATGQGIGTSLTDALITVLVEAIASGMGAAQAAAFVTEIAEAIGGGEGTGWVISDIYFGILKRWDGSLWVKEPLKVYLGSWQTKPLKRWDGTEWKLIDITGI